MGISIKSDKYSFKVGDTVKVTQVIKEGEKERKQMFEGVVVGIKKGENATFTVRKIGAGGVGVERIWPIDTPWISSIEVVKTGKVKRGKLNFLRNLSGRRGVRKIRRKDIEDTNEKKIVG